MYGFGRRKEPLRLFTTEQLLGLLERAYELLDERVPEDPEDSLATRWNEQPLWENHLLAWELLRFVPMAAAVAQDVTVLEKLDHLLEVASRYDDERSSREDLIFRAVGLFAAAPNLGDEMAKRLATHAEQGVRAAAASGFRVENPVQRALLVQLAQDGHTATQVAAKAKLARVGGVPWWFGCFTRDPAEFVPAEELEAHRAALEALAVYRAKSHAGSPRAVLEALSPSLRADAAWCVLQRAPLTYGLDPAWCEALVSTEEGLEQLFAVLHRWTEEDGYDLERVAASAFAGLSPTRKRVAFGRLAELLLGVPERELRLGILVSKSYTELLARSWGPEEDPRPVLEWLSSLPEASEEVARARSEIAEVVLRSHGALDAEGWALLFDVHRRGYPEGWGPLFGVVLEALLQGPTQSLRVEAQSAVASSREELHEWGMRALLTTAFDETVDRSKRGLMERFLRDARLRKTVLASEPLLLLALPLLRKRLRLGKLKLSSARVVVRRIRGLWPPSSKRKAPRSEYEKQQAETLKLERAQAESLLPGRYRGPVRASEWRAYRALRDDAIARNKKGWTSCVGELPAGPTWRPGDEPLREALWRLLREKKRLGPWAAVNLASALARYPSHEDLPLWAVLLEKAPSRSRPLVKRSRAECYRALGVPLPEPRAAGGAEPRSEAPEEDW